MTGRRLAGLSLAVLAGLAGGAAAAETPPVERRLAVTFDDLPLAGPLDAPLVVARSVTADLLAVLAAHRVPAIGFVNESKLLVAGEVDARIALLEEWLAAGHDLGNHTFSHPSLQTTPPAEFEADVLRGDVIIRWLLGARGGSPRYFRHPFLRVGPDPATRQRIEAFLEAHGYRVAPVTVDNDDYVFAVLYDAARKDGDTAAVGRVVAAYLEHMELLIDHYERLAAELFGRPIGHVLLLHANRLNAERGAELFGRIATRGYRFATLDEVLDDPAYRSPDRHVGPQGLSWLYHWARARGLDPPIQPDPPRWVLERYRVLQQR